MSSASNDVDLEVVFSKFRVSKFSTFSCELLEINANEVEMNSLLDKLDEYENEGETRVSKIFDSLSRQSGLDIRLH